VTVLSTRLPGSASPTAGRLVNANFVSRKWLIASQGCDTCKTQNPQTISLHRLQVQLLTSHLQRMKRIPSLASVLRTPSRPVLTLFGRKYSTISPRLQEIPPADMATISGDDGPTAPAPPVVNNSSTTPAAQEDKPLPKLTASEFRQYNRMAEHMNYFHDNFRATWKVLYGACEAQKRPKNMSIRQFISMGQQFCRKHQPATLSYQPI
jgi:hypothetical protein